MYVPIHMLISQSNQILISKIPKPLDANCFFQSVRELEDYIKNDTTAFVGQVIVVDKDAYIVTEIGEKPRYHKLQTEQSRITIDEYGCIYNIEDYQ